MRLAFLTDFSEQFPYRLLRGIYKYAQENKQHWTVCRMPSSLREQHPFEDFVSWCRQWQADVVIGQFTSEVDLLQFRKNGIIVFAQDYISPFPGIPNITADYHKMGEMAAERCVARGFREFAFFGNNGMCWSDGRRDGFRDYLEEAGYGDHLYIYNQQRISNLWYYRQDLLRDWLLSLPKPVGVFCCDDNQALILAEACNALDIEIPYQVAILGVDNDEILCNMSNPPLTSIDVDIERGGYEVAAMVTQMQHDPSYQGNDIVLQPLHIVTRESSNLITTKDVQVHKALTFIHSNIGRKIQVTDVLAVVPMSRRLLEQRFLKATGKTVYQYISDQRINYFARLLLDTDEPIGNLAARMDEPDPKSLSRRFKELKGCTPSEYRKRNLRKSGT